jgi:hypothetical protein
MSINFRNLSEALRFVVRAHMPIIIRGRHGIGKSCVAYQLADELTQTAASWAQEKSTVAHLAALVNGMPVIERRASQMTEGDLLGLPKLENDRTRWLAPDWLKEACETPVLLFIDEIDRATPEVRQGFFELCDSRKIAGHRLHPDTIIIAAVNGGEHGALYQVGEMDPAELDRYTVFDVAPDVEDWLAWATRKNAKGQQNILQVIVEFIRENPQHLEHNEAYEPNKVYPSRRSWDRLSQTMVLGGADLYELGSPNPVLSHVVTGFVGLETMIAFSDYIQNYARNITVEDILDKGNIELTADLDINGHCALIEKIAESDVAKNPLTPDQIKNLGSYFVTLPSEAAMKLWTAVSASNLENAVALHQLPDCVKYLIALTSELPNSKNEA